MLLVYIFPRRWHRRLVVELTQEGDTPADPVRLGPVGRHGHHHDEVGGVSGGGERAPPLARLVHRRVVDLLLRDLIALQRPQPNLHGNQQNR